MISRLIIYTYTGSHPFLARIFWSTPIITGGELIDDNTTRSASESSWSPYGYCNGTYVLDHDHYFIRLAPLPEFENGTASWSIFDLTFMILLVLVWLKRLISSYTCIKTPTKLFSFRKGEPGLPHVLLYPVANSIFITSRSATIIINYAIKKLYIR